MSNLVNINFSFVPRKVKYPFWAALFLLHSFCLPIIFATNKTVLIIEDDPEEATLKQDEPEGPIIIEDDSEGTQDGSKRRARARRPSRLENESEEVIIIEDFCKSSEIKNESKKIATEDRYKEVIIIDELLGPITQRIKLKEIPQKDKLGQSEKKNYSDKERLDVASGSKDVACGSNSATPADKKVSFLHEAQISLNSANNLQQSYLSQIFSSENTAILLPLQHKVDMCTQTEAELLQPFANFDLSSDEIDAQEALLCLAASSPQNVTLFDSNPANANIHQATIKAIFDKFYDYHSGKTKAGIIEKGQVVRKLLEALLEYIYLVCSNLATVEQKNTVQSIRDVYLSSSDIRQVNLMVEWIFEVVLACQSRTQMIEKMLEYLPLSSHIKSNIKNGIIEKKSMYLILTSVLSSPSDAVDILKRRFVKEKNKSTIAE